jgi:hypothetical protein
MSVTCHSEDGFVSRVEFDQYAGQYEAILAAQTQFFDGDGNFFARYKIELAQQLGRPRRGRPRFRLRHRPQRTASACDLPGRRHCRLRPFRRQSRNRTPGEPRLPFLVDGKLGPDSKFDLVIASYVFHHIPPQDWQMAIRYCYSRLKEDRHFIIFEHNPINPVTRHLVKNCPFDADAVLLSTKPSA